MKEALGKKDTKLAYVWMEANAKTKAAEDKLKSVGELEEENKTLKVAAKKSAEELVELKQHYTEWESRLEQLSSKKLKLEQYVEEFCNEMSKKLKEFYVDVEFETEKIEKELDPSRQILRDNSALAVLRLEERIEKVIGYLNRLRSAFLKIHQEVAPGEEFSNDLESIMDRVRDVPTRVQSWKKSSARCGADIFLSLVRVHCKGMDEEKLKSLKVVNKKHAKFEDFMETFLAAATPIANDIDLDTFVDAAAPSPTE